MKPSPIDPKIFTTKARASIAAETGVTINRIGTLKIVVAITYAAISEAIEVTVDDANEARQRPARYGGEDFGET